MVSLAGAERTAFARLVCSSDSWYRANCDNGFAASVRWWYNHGAAESLMEQGMAPRTNADGARVRRWWEPLLVGLILALALGLRVYGWDWDEGHLFHPDERQIYMLVRSLSLPWPPDWENLLSPESTLNPQFFAYGSFPMYLLKAVSSLAAEVNNGWGPVHRLCLFGRPLSALFDLATVALIYQLGRKLYGRSVGLLGAALGAVTVLHIQLSHFYAVDTILTFFVVLTVSLAVELLRHGGLRRGALLGVSIGLALATKVSAVTLLFTAAVAWALLAGATNRATQPNTESRVKRLWGWVWRVLLGMLVTSAVSVVTFLLFEPYALLDVVRFVSDYTTQSWMVQGRLDVPYVRQYLGRPDYIYEIRQLVLWFLGAPLGVTVLLGLMAVVARVARRRGDPGELVLLSWALPYFAIVGSFSAKFLRYTLPVIPFLLLFGARLLMSLPRTSRSKGLKWAARGVLVLVLGSTGLYAAAFVGIYTQRHPWIQATEWICENVPRGSRLTSEHWDDPLPLTQMTGQLRCAGNYSQARMELYDDADEAKLEWLVETVCVADYIVLSSNRLYGTIPRLPDRYPFASRYYRYLFGGELGFDLVYHATAYPVLGPVTLMEDTFSDAGLPVPAGLQDYQPSPYVLRLGHADESFAVYDHPQPLVFEKVRPLSRAEIRAMLEGG